MRLSLGSLLRRLPLLMALAGLLLVSRTTRADHIDQELSKRIPDLVKDLQAKGYNNIGVLRFQLQKGKQAPTYSAGQINGNLSTRLENLLIMHNDKEKPLGIIRGAASVAADKAPTTKGYLDKGNEKLRQTLFTYDYPLAWGDSRVKADAFLTGLVRLSEDMRTTGIVLAAFDHKANTLEEVMAFKVPTDRTILAEAGQSFVVPRGLALDRIRKVKSREMTLTEMGDKLDMDAADSARLRDNNKTGSGNANEYLDFTVLYAGQPQAPQGDASEGGELRIPRASPGQPITFQMRNKTSEKIGVVIMVNGRPTLGESKGAPDDCRRWILAGDNTTYHIDGYYDDNDVLRPFQVVDSASERVKNENADKLGMIEVFVFIKGAESPTNSGKITDDQAGGADAPMKISDRGLGAKLRGLPLVNQKTKPRTAKEAREQLRGGSAVVSRGGGILVPSENTSQVKIASDELTNPTLISTPIVIRYFDPGADK